MTLSLIAFVLVLILSFIGVPLAFATLIIGFAGFVYLRGFDAAMAMSGQWTFETITNEGLSIIPLFVLMGAFIHRSGISRDLFTASYAWLGRFRGGLAMSGIVSCAGFAAVCGSSLATAATMSHVALPSMKEFKYNEGFSAGSIAAGGTLGIMIPPSVPFAIYGIIAGEDIGQLFIAGILPGILLVLLFIGTIIIITSLRPAAGPRGVAMSLKDTIRASYSTWPVMLIFFVILGGIYSGFTTPTEAAAVGALASFVFGLLRGHFMNWRELYEVFHETMVTTAMIFSIVFSTLILAQFVNLTGMPHDLLGILQQWNMSASMLVLLISMICIFLGMVFESIGILLLITPVFLPSLRGLGVDMIWFGVLTVLVIEIGLVAPPIGMNVFTVKACAPHIPLKNIFAGVMPFFTAMIIALAMIFYLPGIAIWLPRLMH